MKKKETKLKSNEFYLNKNYPKLKKKSDSFLDKWGLFLLANKKKFLCLFWVCFFEVKSNHFSQILYVLQVT